MVSRKCEVEFLEVYNTELVIKDVEGMFRALPQKILRFQALKSAF